MTASAKKGGVIAGGLLYAGVALAPASAADACRNEIVNDVPFVACAFDPKQHRIETFHADEEGAPYRHFRALAADLARRGRVLAFAMNAGMYDKARRPIGLYVENGEVQKTANTNDGPGNFHLKPNGVFYVDTEERAGVMETSAFLAAGTKPRFATQSGPMLVIDGAVHPRFLPDSASRKIRNGVGVGEDGTVYFAKSDGPVTFHAFATYFRDRLGAPNALFLDGTISRVYAPEIGRRDAGAAMGPMVGVVE
ncbi:MAG: phosphodiester glycosidase family protein [Pseudomonadota bacterium]